MSILPSRNRRKRGPRWSNRRRHEVRIASIDRGTAWDHRVRKSRTAISPK
jgi:hypothetical protein